MKHLLFSVFFVFVITSKSQNFQWAGTFSGKFTELIMSGCTDAAGNYYATGSFQDTVDFDPGIGVNNLIAGQDPDIFIFKLTASGNFVWAKSIKSNGWDSGKSIAVDANGNIIVVGFYNGTADFDPGSSTFNLTPELGSQDGFILKLNAAGNFVWAQSLGYSNSEELDNVVTDNLGNIYFTGIYDGNIDLDPGTGIVPASSNSGSIDFFIEKFDATGNFIWGKSIGGTGTDNCTSLAIDVNGNIYVQGTYSATVDFDPGAAVVNKTSNGGNDIFILKLNNAANFIWVNTFGGNLNEVSGSLKVDVLGNCYTASSFAGNVDVDPSASTYTLSSTGGMDICIQKFDNNGNFIWARQSQGSSNEIIYDLAINSNSDIFLTGYFEGTADFDPSPSVVNLNSNGTADVFIQALDKDGNLIWVRSIGATGTDFGTSLCLDNNHNIFISGTFQSTVDFDPGPSTFNLISNNVGDAYVLKLNQNILSVKEAALKVIASIYPNPTSGNLSISLDKEYENIHVQVSSVNGQLISSKTENSVSEMRMEMNVPAGLYIVTVKVNNGEASKFRIIKT